MSAFKVLVTGSRHWEGTRPIRERLAALKETHGDLIVIQGGYHGADRHAARAAQQLDLHCAEVKALWARGKRAGPARNRAMLDLEPDLVLGFPLPGSGGTWDTVREAQRRAIETWVWHPEVDG